MFNLSKTINKKLSGRLLGVKEPYSISFINCQMDWYDIPVLKKLAEKNYPTLDNLVGIPDSYGQTKSSVVVRVFVSRTNDDVEGDFKEFQEDSFLNSEDAIELLTPVIGAFQIKAGDYKINKANNIFIGEAKNKVLRVIGKTENGLKAANFSETVFVFTPSFLLIFDLTIMDEDEPKMDIIESDFIKILNSIKLQDD